MRCLTALLLAALATPLWAAPATACRVPGIASEVRCGSVDRPLDPAQPAGPRIELHYVVVPATARRKFDDPVFLLAGGPGQSAIALAGATLPLLARLANRRDTVFVDQRGTGRSAPLDCAVPRHAPLAEQLDTGNALALMQRCREALTKLPHGDLRFYTTTLAVDDLDAVRRAIGAARINIVGASYGTRVGLELLRRHPQAVRRAVLDGVAPPDMVLPVSFSTDNQAAFDALVAVTPGLRRDWDALLARLPVETAVVHPVTGRPETLTIKRDTALAAVRGPLYVPALASALPAALAGAAAGRFDGLVGLATALGGGRGPQLAMGMHFSVVCAEDAPRLDVATDPPGADFGDSFAALYRGVCAQWPRGEVPADFTQMPAAQSPVLLLSGGIDPATPPRHGARVAAALGAKARHVVVPHAGHGVLAIGCMRDVLFRFVAADTDADALAVAADCAARMPRPTPFALPQAAP